MAKLPRYRVVTDERLTHKGIVLGESCRRTHGSGRPFVAAVLVVRSYSPLGCACDVRCVCPNKDRRLQVIRRSFTLLAAQEFCDELRGQGEAALVVAMEPEPEKPKRPRGVVK